MTGHRGDSGATYIRRTPVLLISLILSLPAISFGGTPRVEFPEAVSRAMKNNPYLAAAGEDWEAAKQNVVAARGAYLPGLVFEERFVRTNIPSEAFAFKINQERLLPTDFASVDNFNKPPPINEYMTTFTAEQALFAPKAFLGIRMAGREADAVRQDLRRKREEVAYQVLSAYLSVLTSKEYVGIARQGVEDAREHHRIAETMEKSGMGLASDVLRAKVFLASAEGSGVTAENRLLLAQRELGLAMGEPGGGAVDAGAGIPPLPEEGSLEEKIAAALAGRADLGATALRVENASADVNLQRSDYLPTVGVMGAWQSDGQDGPFSRDNSSWKVGVGLKWNLFDGFRREAAVARSASESGKAKAYYRGAKDRAVFQVTQAWLAVDEARKRVEIARSAAASAGEGTRLIKTRYENRLSRMVDLLDAQSALNTARADLVKAENDLRQSRAGLLFASGTLLPWALSGTEEKR